MTAAFVLCGCAKTASVKLNEVSKRYFEAFIQTHYPDAGKTELGAYLIEPEVIGTGKALGDTSDSRYVMVEYTVTDLEGNVVSTTSEKLAQQVGTYSKSTYYGPVIWFRPDHGVYAGLEESLKKMNIGGRRKLAVPGWLMSYDDYSTAQEYEDNCSGTAGIYDIKVVNAVNNIVKWQIDSIANYLSRNFPGVSVTDSAAYGYYYIQREAPTDTTKFPEDTTFYINYIGRLLDGTVFDTNIKDTAKFYGIYDDSGTYTPGEITYDSDSGTYQMGGNSVITGFSMTLARVREYEKATAIFYSGLGYGNSSSSDAIPAYSPLRFDVDVVDNPDEEE